MSGVTTFHRPAKVDELAEVVASAAAGHQSLLIRGGGTHQSFANLAGPFDEVVETTRLDAVIDYSPVDLTLAVQSGVTLAKIDDLLKECGQQLPVDAPHRVVTTIGGQFASGLSGPRRLRYGALKDLVIGAEIVNAEGEVTKSGGMVVKNVSGYELARLHHGAHGAFGIVTRLNLKVMPLPESTRELRLAFASADDAARVGIDIATSALEPAAVYVSGGVDRDWVLHVVVEGSRGFVDSQISSVEMRATAESVATGTHVEDLDGATLPMFDRFVDLTSVDGGIVARLSIPASRQAACFRSLSDFPIWKVVGDVGSGIVYARCPAEPDNFTRIRGIDSRAVFLAMPDAMKSGLDVFGGVDASAATILKRLKAEFDPSGTFNRGRFALGL